VTSKLMASNNAATNRIRPPVVVRVVTVFSRPPEALTVFRNSFVRRAVRRTVYELDHPLG
jgi:hypothetical protein